MIEIPDSTDTTNISPSVAAVRARLMDGLTTVEVFAEAIGKTTRQVQNWIRAGMPAVYLGRTPHPIIDEAREWLANKRRAD